MREKVSNPPVLLDVVLGVGLQGMDHVRELDAITDEEDWHVVTNKIPVTLPGKCSSRSAKSTKYEQGLWTVSTGLST